MYTRGGKDDIAGNAMVGAVLLALANPSLGPFVIVTPGFLKNIKRYYMCA
jgi:hypothetical protein